MKKAYFAGGCFWCVTPMFADIEGVISVTSGYCGGDEDMPTYEQVKSQSTGHRETVMIEYDEDKTDFSSLLDIFFDNVDLTDGEGQYIDRGRSYTLAVYFQTDEERLAANALIEQRRKASERVCVSVEKLKRFYPAEEYHQNYYLKEPEAFREEMISSGRSCPLKKKSQRRL